MDRSFIERRAVLTITGVYTDGQEGYFLPNRSQGTSRFLCYVDGFLDQDL